MRGLLALIAVLVSVAAAVFLWRHRQQPASEMWDDVEDSASSWAATAEDKVDEATGTVAAMSGQAGTAAPDAADRVPES